MMASRSASPPTGLERRVAALRGPSGWLLLGLAAVYAWSVFAAPIDSVQGPIQKILYVHPPMAFGAYLGFFLTALGGLLYLWRDDEAFDRMAISGAEVGVLFCTLMMITGPIWAKGTWGKWWTWDPRLTVTLLLWFVYLAYILLRGFTEGGPRTARFAAVYGMLGVLLIPLNYYVIEIFQGRGMHPENLERGSLGDGMGLPFLMGCLTALAAFAHLFVRRWELEALRAREALRAAEASPRGGEEFA